jgi:hypothetical protein
MKWPNVPIRFWLGRDQGISIEASLQGLIDGLALRFLTAVRT